MTTQCPHCEGDRFTVRVSSELSSYTESAALACCRRCLSVTPGDPEEASSEPPFQSIIQRFPTGTEGVWFLVLLDNLDSLALNRRDIESLVEHLETNGVDLFLTLDRLLADPEIDPEIDLGRRRDQLEQVLD